MRNCLNEALGVAVVWTDRIPIAGGGGEILSYNTAPRGGDCSQIPHKDENKYASKGIASQDMPLKG